TARRLTIGELFFSRPGAKFPTLRVLPRHRAAHRSDDGHQYGTAQSATDDVRQNCRPIQRASAYGGSMERVVENLTAQATTHNAGNRVPERPEAHVFKSTARNVADKCTDNQLN